MIFHIENGQDLGICKKIGDSVVIQKTFDIFPKKFQRDLRFRKISHMYPPNTVLWELLIIREMQPTYYCIQKLILTSHTSKKYIYPKF